MVSERASTWCRDEEDRVRRGCEEEREKEGVAYPFDLELWGGGPGQGKVQRRVKNIYKIS